MDRRRVRAVVAAVAVGLALLTPGTATAAPPMGTVIAPGALMLTPLDGAGTDTSACTASFVFAGGGSTYIGYAAHCAGAAGGMGLSGCEEPTLPLGTPVFVQRSDGERVRARLAYSSWITMQERGETDRALCFLNDFALVELDPADAGSVDPTVPRLGGPTGLDVDGTRPGESVFSYQPNGSGRAVKSGRSSGDSDGGLTHRVSTSPPGNPGDSGSGYLDADGEAFGVLSTRFTADGSNGVTDLASALRYANRFGGLGGVELVLGTGRFTG